MKDKIIEQVKAEFDKRSQTGIEKYNTTLDQNNKDNFLQHLKEELMDAVAYIQKIQDVDPIALRKRFNKAFNLPIHHKPTLISKTRSNLHYKMMLEELKEYKEAVLHSDLIGITDALIDMQEVLFGMFAEHGLLDKWHELYIEVHKSNMSKLDDNGKPLINGVNCEIDPTRPIGKVLKSKNFIEPDFKRIINN